MNDQDAGVFVVATSNSLKDLPTELKRKGRFDEIFFLDLPDSVSRGEIFVIQLDEFEPGWKNSTLTSTNWRTTDKWTGAEIKAAVNDAQISAFNDGNRPIKMEDLTTYISKSPSSEEHGTSHRSNAGRGRQDRPSGSVQPRPCWQGFEPARQHVQLR